MYRYHQNITDTRTLAIGIKGNLDSLCGAVERLELNGPQWNGFLSLKEQCARRIVLIKNEQLKCFLSANLPPTLFKYVTKDIFNLQRDEFASNYPEESGLCDACSVVTRRKRQDTCDCPEMKSAIRKLSRHFAKRMNSENKTDAKKRKKFELIYKIPDDESGDWTAFNSYFLYLSPSEDRHMNDDKRQDDIDYEDLISFQSYRLINGQASVEEKLLFADVMRFFGGFQTDEEQPHLILCHRCAVNRD